MKKLDFKKIGKRALSVAVAGSIGAGADFIPIDPLWKNLGLAAIGIIGPEFVPKNAMVNDIGVGLAAIGAKGLAAKGASMMGLTAGTGVMGIGDPEYVVQGEEYAVEGAGDNDALGSNSNDALGDVDPY